MPPFRRAAPSREPLTLPLFLLKTVLFPGGLLPLKVFEQRYIDMTKRCLKDDQPFGVCLLTRGDEVARRSAPAAREFAPIGTLARITSWDMPQLGILQLKTEGSERFQVQSHRIADDGLVVAEATPLAAEPRLALSEIHRPLAELLELMVNRVGREHFAGDPALDDASWVGYRLAELLPLPATIKQSMLEINDSEVRLTAITRFLKQQQLL
ncbi:MAG TPA: LON peptidase substrate-binding domain-containing protein [Casimicrobiaceae bacterium]|nr:LON peptidase substrate-binding domain-containing protein [Casimicrobiaceae bacterium]